MKISIDAEIDLYEEQDFKGRESLLVQSVELVIDGQKVEIDVSEKDRDAIESAIGCLTRKDISGLSRV